MHDDPTPSNPYQPPQEPTHDSQSVAQRAAANELSPDCRGNLQLTAKVLRFLAIIAGLAIPYSIVQIALHFSLLGAMPGTSIWMGYLIFLRIIYSLCMLLLIRTTWRYARALDRMVINGVGEIEAVVECQAKAWLSVGLLVFVFLIGGVLLMPFVTMLSTAI